MRVSDTEDLGIIARQRRQQMRISQAELAARAGVTRQWINRFERGNAEVTLSKVFAVIRELSLKVRVDTTEDLDVAAKIAQYEIPRISLPSIVTNINTAELMPKVTVAELMPKVNVAEPLPKVNTSDIIHAIQPLNDPAVLAQMKSRIKALEAVKP